MDRHNAFGAGRRGVGVCRGVRRAGGGDARQWRWRGAVPSRQLGAVHVGLGLGPLLVSLVPVQSGRALAVGDLLTSPTRRWLLLFGSANGVDCRGFSLLVRFGWRDSPSRHIMSSTTRSRGSPGPVPGWCRMRAIESSECVIRMTSQKGKSSSKCDENWATTLEENKKSNDVHSPAPAHHAIGRRDERVSMFARLHAPVALQLARGSAVRTLSTRVDISRSLIAYASVVADEPLPFGIHAIRFALLVFQVPGDLSDILARALLASSPHDSCAWH